MLQEIEGKTDVVLGGLVVGLRKRKTKKGEAWASFLLEDLEGTCEVLVFPRVYGEAQATLQEDAAVLVTGRAEIEEERVKFIADDVTPIAGLRERRAEAASLRLTGTGLEQETLARLGEILSAHRGEVPVYIRLALPHRMSVAIQMGRDWKIHPSPELTAAVVDLLGPGAIVYRAGADPRKTTVGERTGAYGARGGSSWRGR